MPTSAVLDGPLLVGDLPAAKAAPPDGALGGPEARWAHTVSSALTERTGWDPAVWVAAAGAVADEAWALAEEHRSAVAWARAAQACDAAGDGERALDAARHVLRSSEALVGRDEASLQVAAAVMSRHGDAALALDLLEELPSSAVGGSTRAHLLTAVDRVDEALVALEGLSGQEYDALRGYCQLQKGDHAGSVHSLRRSVKGGFDSPETQLNLAAALWALRSRDKAVRAARRATALAPGRLDAHLALLYYLTASNRWAEAWSALEANSRRGWMETQETLLVRARVAAARGDDSTAAKALREARGLVAASDHGTRAAIDGGIVMLDMHRGRVARGAATTKLAALFTRNPRSPSLAICYLDAGRSMAVARQVEASFDPAPGSEELQVLGVRTRIAYLTCDYSETIRLCREWLRLDRTAETPTSLLLVVIGAAGEGWPAAAAFAHQVLRTATMTDQLRNQVAYALAMAGEGTAALGVIDEVEQRDFRATATRGLALLAAGRVDDGLSAYRSAFAAIPPGPERLADEALMVLHQAQGLKALDVSSGPRLTAGALPPAPLPERWEEDTSFVLLQVVAERCSWEWPTHVS